MKKNVFAVIAGRANTGKSTLMNLLVGDKVAIVSDKPQTTRTIINGIITKEDTQYVFIDTPGFHKASNKLSEHMVKHARSGAAGADVVLFMQEPTVSNENSRKRKSDIEILESFKTLKIPVILLINKIDLIKDKSKLLILIEDYSKLFDFAEILPINAKTGENTAQILPILQKYAVEGEHNFPADMSTDQAEKVWLAEIVREKLLRSMFEEIPHGIAVEIESLEKAKTNKGKNIMDMSVVIICEKLSHKGMIIGKQGANLKKIGRVSRLEMEEYFECKVNMKLWVKVKEDWRNKESLIVELGLGYE